MLILLRKKAIDVSSLEPWNHHQGGTFITVDPDRANLASTGIYEKLIESSLVKSIDLTGVDIIQDQNNNAFVLEFNSCPSLSIESNIQKVAEYLVNHPDYN